MSAWASPRLLDATAPENESGLWLYEPYYGLSEKPFSLSTDPRFLYQSPSHTPVFQEVLAGIRRREGLVVLTGEIGMGKTTLCRSVLGTLDRKTFSAFVPDPFVTREDLLKILLVEFGVVSIDDIVRGRLQGASRAELSYPLYEFLRSLEPLDAFAVVLLDEAQNLPVPLLEEIRILSDLEGARKLLQVVLIGQPELSNALRLPHMRQMRQRVTTHCELQPLTREGVYGYVSHRLMIAGGMADRVHFTGDALDLVFEASGGVPRVINRLCDRTLQRGHRARAESIGPELVRAAIDDLQLDPPAPQSMTQASAAAAPPAPAALTAVAEPPVEAPTTAELSAIAFFGVEQTSPASADDPHTLFSPPPTVLPGATAAPADPRADRVSTSDRQRAPRVRHVEAPGAGRGRGAAAAALVVLGVLSGMTMAVYWVWAGPLVTGQTVVPAVKRPSARIAAPLPAVLPPAIDLNDVPTEPVQPAEEPSDENEPSEPFIAAPAALPAVPATQTLWAVQVGTFSDDARASALVGQLAARGLTAFKTVSMRGGATLHVVLVGPYPSRAAAHAGLESAAQIPGVDRPILQPVPPATAALR